MWGKISLPMSLRQYLAIMTIATALCWVSWVFVVQNVDPFAGSALGFLFFYLSTFTALFGTFSLLGFALSYLSKREELFLLTHIHKSFSFGIISAILAVALLYLQGKQILHFWNVGILISIIFFFLLFKWSLRFQRKSQE